MKTFSLPAILLVVASACGTETSDTATDTLAAEESVSGSALASPPDPAGQCDPEAIRTRVVTAYPATDETDRRERRFSDLGLVYDADDSGALDETEQAAIVSDFTAGCAAHKAKLVAEYDTDGDGALSDTELATAREDLAARHPPRGDRPPPPDGSQAEGDRPPPPQNGEAANPDGGHRGPRGNRLLHRYDADGDGTLSTTELATLRTEVRARIVAGERPQPPPPPRPVDDASADAEE